MEVSRNVWLATILVGGLLVALGNINYNSAKDRERGKSASEKALSILGEEFRRNLPRIKSARASLAGNSVPTVAFETTAWDVVSNSGLLTNLDPDTLSNVTRIYYLIGQAERYRSQILDLSIGVASALQSSQATRETYLGYLRTTVDQLEPMLQTEIDRSAKKPGVG